MASQAETGKSGWLKLSTACYYCLASMTVQYMNKARRLFEYKQRGIVFLLSRWLFAREKELAGC